MHRKQRTEITSTDFGRLSIKKIQILEEQMAHFVCCRKTAQNRLRDLKITQNLLFMTYKYTWNALESGLNETRKYRQMNALYPPTYPSLIGGNLFSLLTYYHHEKQILKFSYATWRFESKPQRQTDLFIAVTRMYVIHSTEEWRIKLCMCCMKFYTSRPILLLIILDCFWSRQIYFTFISVFPSQSNVMFPPKKLPSNCSLSKRKLKILR